MKAADLSVVFVIIQWDVYKRQTLHVESELKNLYGTKVSINQKGKKGTIQLEYYSVDELNRLIELLKSVEL